MPLGLGVSIIAFLSTALLTWGWIKIARHKRIHDEPERRRLHHAHVPRAGGISIAIVLCAGSFLISKSMDDRGYWPIILWALIAYSAIGFWDDLRPLHARAKLLFHLLAALGIFLVAMLLSGTGSLAALTIAIAYLLFVNIWNFMDGSNGMVSMQSLCITIGILALGYFPDATDRYALLLAASCLGFIPFNFPAARVFLGDVGSHVLGAAVIGLALLAYEANQLTLLEISCLASGLWIDAILTFIRRVIRGFKVTQPHRSHLYQYAVRHGLSHTAVCWYYVAWTVVVIFLLGVSRQLSEENQRIALLMLNVVGCGIHQWLRLFVLKSGYSPKKYLPAD